MSDSPQEPLALNEISTLFLTGLLQSDRQLEFARTEPSLRPGSKTLSAYNVHDPRCESDEPPENPKPESGSLVLKKPGHRVLEATVGELIGSGKTGFVHAVNASDMEALPALVVKFCLPRERSCLSHEAWFYDDLRAAQGSIIARCYGYFEALLPEGTALKDECHRARFLADPDPHVDWSRRVVEDGRVGILLLERLSTDNIPIGRAFTDQELSEIKVPWEELSYMFVQHNDLNETCIVRALEGPSALPTLPTPLQKKLTPWRIIDLEDCQKHTLPTEWQCENYHLSPLQRIVYRYMAGGTLAAGDPNMFGKLEVKRA